MRGLVRYRVERALGQGAAGGVYLVSDRFGGGAPVALKRLHANADELLRSSFEREFGVLASLSTPGVARVIDFGIAPKDGDDPGGPFFTRVFVDGKPMSTLDATWTLSKRVALLERTAAHVAALHRAGVIHGDLKPDNVIVDKEGRPTLIDFGLARAKQPGRITTSQVAGTPPFMAPELFRGDAASASSDVYALGAMLWWVVTRELPFSEFGARALSMKLGGRLPSKPKELDELGAPALDIALRALVADPELRTPAVAELAVALRALQSNAGDPREGAFLGEFLPPRPLGHDALLARLEASFGGDEVGQAREGRAILLDGEPGAGRSTLLRELKWRLQVRAHCVLELFVRPSEGARAFEVLLHQALVFADDAELRTHVESLLERLAGADDVRESELVDTTRRLLSHVAERQSVVVLVDDLHAGERALGDALRVALAQRVKGGLGVVATTRDANAAAARALCASEVVRVNPLTRGQVDELSRSALGAVGDDVLAAIATRAAGNPQQLMLLLRALSTNASVTVQDVERVEPSEEAIRNARARLLAAKSAHPLLELLATARFPLSLTAVRAALKGTHFSEPDLHSAVSDGLIDLVHERLSLADPLVGRLVLESVDDAARKALARRVAAMPEFKKESSAVRAAFSLFGGDDKLAHRALDEAARDAEREGAIRTAIEFRLEAKRRAPATRVARDALQLSLLHHACGEYELAVQEASAVVEAASATAEERSEAAVAMGRSRVALGQFEGALLALADVGSSASVRTQALAARERAKAHLRLGNYSAVLAQVEIGRSALDANDYLNVELLTSAGMVHTYQGEHTTARALYESALSLAKAASARRDEGNCLTYLAIDHHRAGDYERAESLYEASLAISRELGDIGSMATYELNLGAVCADRGRHALATEHYERATKLAGRAGRVATQISARANLANLNLYLGLYERVRSDVDAVRFDARAHGVLATEAQATLVSALLLAREGDVDGAVVRCDQAASLYRELGHHREFAEALLDSAEVLLDRAGPTDASAASPRLSSARTVIEERELKTLTLRLRFLLARARAETLDPKGGIADLEAVRLDATSAHDAELEWLISAALARVWGDEGNSALAAASVSRAIEILDRISAALPDELKDAFWHDPRRRALRKRRDLAKQDREKTTMLDQRVAAPTNAASRLLEITKRLAREHQIDRLLERITDAAVDLAGAERGFVLLTDSDGTLAPRAARTAHAENDAHVAFSRSIAEAVLIDGESIITMDARDDRRLSEYMSVHKLMLRSVACLPIRGHQRTLGVLYLEHRRSSGRFREDDMEVLEAFADQAAIALENARLLSENEDRRKALEAANAELARAKDEIERLLVARTEELHDAKAELDRTRHAAIRSNARFGIVGRSAPMLRVFAILDRLRESSVPVVIHGESGTGKELVARALHSTSARAQKPFVALNCAAMPEPLLESELFGHVKGAFTGADRARRGVLSQASTGTLFLDEVGDMPMKMQIDLLRVLSDKRVRPIGSETDEEIDVRIVAASNKSLEKLVAAGKFREDLFYRLNVVEIRLPALRDRIDDLPILCDHFLAKIGAQSGAAPKRITRKALERLASLRLPGNVRQLEHLLLNACVLVSGDTIDADDLAIDTLGDDDVRETVARPVARSAENVDAAMADNVEAFKGTEKQRILAALKETNWNRAKAAEALGMPRRTFYRRLEEYKIL